MFSAFSMGPAASGRRLSDIDRVIFRATKSREKCQKSVKKTESLLVMSQS